MKRTSTLILAGLCAGLVATTAVTGEAAEETKAQRDARMAWWREAKFGMFIHWGPVSLTGHEIGWSRGKQTPVEVYDKLYERFNPVKFNADAWARTAKEAGMKYLVITAKHHDGFCLWDSEHTDYDIMSTPFKRDILRELADACHKQDIMFCTYYSICDWWHPDYPTGSPAGKSQKSPHNMSRYFTYLRQQTSELVKNYGPIGVMWFDGEWEKPWTQNYGSLLYEHLRGVQPDLIINNRVGKGRHGMAGTTKEGAGVRGDFDTPEQRVGGFNRERPWETCMTICRQWSWKPNDNMKSLEQCLQALIRTAGGDGNLLFNVGPMPDGRIEPRQVERLKEMGAWLKTYGVGIYGTRGGPFKPGAWGASTCKGNTVYLYIMQWPASGKLALSAVSQRVLKCRVLSGGEATWEQTAGGIDIAVPEEHRHKIATVIALEMEGQGFDIEPASAIHRSESLGVSKKDK